MIIKSLLRLMLINFIVITKETEETWDCRFYNEKVDLVKINQDNTFNVKKLTNIDSKTVNRNPALYNELTNKKYIDIELDKNTILRFNQTLQNYLKICFGNDTNNLTKYDKTQLIDVTEIRYPNNGDSF